jgi:uncharacterized protein YprB with RNaseH-like and TPR domain
MRIAFFDIETTGLFADFDIMLVGVIKEYKGKYEIFRIDQTKGYARMPYYDYDVVRRFVNRLLEFDIIVGYNCKKFDIPFLNTRLLVYNDDKYLTGIKVIDLLQVFRTQVRLHSRSLKSVSEAIVGLQKTPVLPDYWLRARHGDRKAFEYIVKHCKRDVEILEEVYEKTKGLIKRISMI